MFIASNNNILIPGVKGKDPVRISKGFVGEVPDWVGGTAYFKALVKCGKITLSEPGKDKKSRKTSTKPPKAETPPENPGKNETPEPGAGSGDPPAV